MIYLPVDPVPKPRMTQSDRWNDRDCVTRYWRFKDDLHRAASEAGYKMGDAIRVTFLVPMPASWSRRKRAGMNRQKHQARPDLDNYTKSLLDSLRPGDDAAVWRIEAEKRWAETGGIMIENLEDAI